MSPFELVVNRLFPVEAVLEFEFKDVPKKSLLGILKIVLETSEGELFKKESEGGLI